MMSVCSSEGIPSRRDPGSNMKNSLRCSGGSVDFENSSKDFESKYSSGSGDSGSHSTRSRNVSIMSESLSHLVAPEEYSERQRGRERNASYKGGGDNSFQNSRSRSQSVARSKSRTRSVSRCGERIESNPPDQPERGRRVTLRADGAADGDARSRSKSQVRVKPRSRSQSILRSDRQLDGTAGSQDDSQRNNTRPDHPNDPAIRRSLSHDARGRASGRPRISLTRISSVAAKDSAQPHRDSDLNRSDDKLYGEDSSEQGRTVGILRTTSNRDFDHNRSDDRLNDESSDLGRSQTSILRTSLKWDVDHNRSDDKLQDDTPGQPRPQVGILRNSLKNDTVNAIDEEDEDGNVRPTVRSALRKDFDHNNRSRSLQITRSRSQSKTRRERVSFDVDDNIGREPVPAVGSVHDRNGLYHNEHLNPSADYVRGRNPLLDSLVGRELPAPSQKQLLSRRARSLSKEIGSSRAHRMYDEMETNILRDIVKERKSANPQGKAPAPKGSLQSYDTEETMIIDDNDDDSFHAYETRVEGFFIGDMEDEEDIDDEGSVLSDCESDEQGNKSSHNGISKARLPFTRKGKADPKNPEAKAKGILRPVSVHLSRKPGSKRHNVPLEGSHQSIDTAEETLPTDDEAQPASLLVESAGLSLMLLQKSQESKPKKGKSRFSRLLHR